MKNTEVITLPKPCLDGPVSVEKAIQARRSVRRYQNEPLAPAEISQLLWAAQGITNSRGYRSVPSAGALYPLEVYVIAGQVKGLEAGIYKYKYHDHTLIRTISGDQRAALSRAGLHQGSIQNAPVTLLICAVYERVTRSYGQRGIRYTDMEVGHAAQNICLQAVSLKLGTVVIGAFRDQAVKEIANLPADERPLYLIPVGRM